jgi:opacity protein-like surface antigen
MKRIVLLMIAAISLVVPSSLLAQSELNHFEVGAFADYFNLSRTTPHINFVGLGARVAVNVQQNVQLEAEMAYDFNRSFDADFTDNSGGVQLVRTKLRPLHAMFGPKFQTSGPFRLFATGKVGFVNFSTSNQNASSGFQGALGSVTTGNTRFAVYPGLGVEGFWGPIGVRLEAGDEIYFDNGSRNNLKVTFGPQFRF